MRRASGGAQGFDQFLPIDRQVISCVEHSNSVKHAAKQLGAMVSCVCGSDIIIGRTPFLLTTLC